MRSHNRTTKPGALNNEGAALIMLLFVLIVVGLFGVVLNIRSINESRLVQRQAYQTQALWAAESGVQRTYYEIKSNNCTGMKNKANNMSCTSCDSCGSGDRLLTGTVNGGEFEVLLTSTLASAVASGYAPSKADPKALRNVRFAFGSDPLFSFAAFAKGAMTISNNALVDSYNSDNGAYGGANIGQNGDIGTNGTSAGIIIIGNNASIMGDVSTGSGGTVTTGAGVTITGDTSHDNNIEIPSVTVPTTLTSLADGGICSIPGSGTRTLAGGNYRYQSITFANNGELIINGDVEIYLTAATALNAGNNNKITINSGAKLVMYVDGVINIWNNVQINNVGKKAADFAIYSTYDGAAGVSIKNNSNAYVTIYSPDTDVDINQNANFYGAIVGGTVNIENNDQVHYDEVLEAVGSPFSEAHVRNWEEI